jgi:hypothetical protein
MGIPLRDAQKLADDLKIVGLAQNVEIHPFMTKDFASVCGDWNRVEIVDLAALCCGFNAKHNRRPLIEFA